MQFLALMVCGVMLVFGFALLFSVPVWLLWNWLMPEIFGLPEIGWLQAFGLMVLSGFLLKSSNTRSK